MEEELRALSGVLESVSGDFFWFAGLHWTGMHEAQYSVTEG